MNWQGFKLRLAIIPVYATQMMMAACQIETSSVSNERVGLVKVLMERQNRHRSTFSPESSADDLSCADPAPSIFEIVVEDQETLVLDFGTNDEGEGFFDWFRVPSAPFRNSHEIAIQPGSEVAQINWDDQITYIDWVKVQEVITHDGLPRLVLANPINNGSSGGGVLWNGAHIANNWMRVAQRDEGGTETYQYSIAALNSVAVAPN
jgi:hypothetical protein